MEGVDKMPKLDRFLYSVIPLAFGFVALGCDSGSFQSIQRIVSNDGKHWADVSVNRGNALEYDWYAVEVGKVFPTWTDTILRRDVDSVCTLQGRGQISIA
jgi:hypothetical protein